MSHIRGTVAAVILAAGEGRRFGTGALTPPDERGSSPDSGAVAPLALKPLALFRGRPLVVHVLEAAVASGLGPVVLVVGNRSAEVAAVAPVGIEIVHNDAWRDGIATSLHAALMHLASRGVVHGAVVGLADQPLIGAEAWMRLGAAYDSGTELAVATYEGVRANPVLVGRTLWPEALTLVGDAGARQLFSRHEVIDIECGDTGRCVDVETPEELAAIQGM